MPSLTPHSLPGGPTGAVVSDPQAQQHITDNHSDTFTYEGFCIYSGDAVPYGVTQACGVESDSDIISTNPVESGQLVTGIVHTIKDGKTEGQSFSNGPQVESGADGYVGVLSCPLGVCNLSVSVGANTSGLTSSVTYTPSSTLWNATKPYSSTCAAKNAPVCASDPDDEPSDPAGGNGYWLWSTTSCTWVWHRLGSTPIIIDTDGSGFNLTSSANGIKWDFYGVGHPIQIAWTAPGSTNGWLAIDLNGNGTIDSGLELFSNVASQPANQSDANAPDGFNDLSQYDSNHDGVIDKNDPVWPRLLIWIDSNHDGISQPNELHSLDSLGIHSISTSYTMSPKTDQYGNQFHLKGTLNPGQNDQGVNPVIYDVYLTQ